LADGVTNAHSVEEKIKNEDIEKITQLLKKIINGYKNFIA
jgi:di/tripeptidase